MGVAEVGRRLWEKTLHLLISAARVQAVILHYIVSSIACFFNGKSALQGSRSGLKLVESSESCNAYAPEGEEYSDGDDERPRRCCQVKEGREHIRRLHGCPGQAPKWDFRMCLAAAAMVTDRYVYVDTALAAIDQFWSKAEEKVWEMARRRVPNRTKMLLLDAIQESYNKLKFRLRQDLSAQEIDLEDSFEPLLAERNKKLAELRFLLVHSDTREDFQYEEHRPEPNHEALEGQISSLSKVLSSADLLARRPSSMVEMIPVLKDVQREVSGMLEYLEGCRPNFNPNLIKDLSAEYQYK